MSVLLAEGVTPELEELWKRALHDVSAKRGGSGASGDPVRRHAAGPTSCRRPWPQDRCGSFHDDALKGFALCRAQLIEAMYVAHDFRRQKVATTIVRHLLDECCCSGGRLRAARGPGDEIALRVDWLEGATAYDARRVAGRRTGRPVASVEVAGEPSSPTTSPVRELPRRCAPRPLGSSHRRECRRA